MKLIKKLIPFKTKRNFKEKLGVPSLHWSLENLKSMGYSPNAVLDIGAYEGFWTLDFKEVFPKSRVLMLDAQEKKKLPLSKVAGKFPDVQYFIALLSASDGKEYNFFENETSSHAESEWAEGSITLASRSVDSILAELSFPSPDFIKIDVQGFELEVLRGASQAMVGCEFCLLEVSLLNLGNEPLVLQVMNFMDQQGFQLYDVCQFMRRPYDKALYQMDFLFVKKTSRFIASKRWN